MNKILTWNLRHGGGSRVTMIIETLKLHSNATTIILTEFRNNENASIIQSSLSESGFIHQFTTTAEPTKNSVLIASKENFKSKTFPELAEHSQRVIKVFNDNFSIYGCYFPGQDNKKYIFDFLLKEIKQQPTSKIIITGDINTGKHFIDEKGATFFHSDYINKIEEHNFFDAWRHFHHDKKEYTWFSNAGNGFRLDHFFVHNNLKEKVVSCNYIHDYREEKISDHSMMLLELTDKLS